MAEERMEAMENVETYDDCEYDEYTEAGGGGVAKVVVGLVGSAVAAGATAVIVKNRGKISEFRRKRRIKKLAKDGFTVLDENGVDVTVEPEEIEVVETNEK